MRRRHPVLTLAFTCALALILSACSPRRENGGGGVVDGGGGGDLIYNERDEVLRAIDQAWKTVIAETPSNPVFYAYEKLKTLGTYDKRDNEPEVLKVVTAILSGVENIPDAPPDSSNFELPGIRYLKNKKLNLQEKGLCSGPGDHKFLASVNRLDRSGEICISVSGLMKLPSGNLKRDLIALLVHEIAHLNGADETTARKVQKYFIKSMARLLRENGDEIKSTLRYQYEIHTVWAWQNLIPKDYSLITDFNRDAAKDLQKRLHDLKIPDPYIGQELNIAQPDRFAELQTDLARLQGYSQLLSERYVWKVKNSKREFKADDLAEVKNIALRMERFGDLFNFYLFGEPLNRSPKEHTLIERATDPKALIDSSLRPELRQCIPQRCGIGEPRLVGRQKKP